MSANATHADTDLRALLERKECELFSSNYSANANAAQVQHINALTREVASLRQRVAALTPKWKLAPIEGSRLTSGYLPKPEPVDWDYLHGSRDYDPVSREFGLPHSEREE